MALTARPMVNIDLLRDPWLVQASLKTLTPEQV